jgi:hypothetical protein
MTPNTTYLAKDAPADKTEAARLVKTPYWEAIGSLMYTVTDACLFASICIQVPYH